MSFDAEIRENDAKSKRETKKKSKGKAENGKPVVELFLPATQTVSGVSVALGHAMRGALSFLATASFCNFLFDSFGLSAIGRGGVYLIAFLLTAVFVLMTGSVKRYFVGLGTIALSLTVGILVSGNPAHLVMGMFPAAWNTAMHTLEQEGYHAFAPLNLTNIAMPLFSLIAAFQIFFLLTVGTILFLSVYTKVRLLPIAFCGLVTMLPVFTYNIAYSSVDFSIIILSISGILALRYYDRAMKKQTDAKTHSAYGGYMGLGAALLAALALLIPVTTVKAEWEEIRGVNETMELARTVLSSVLMGERPDWTSLQSMGNMDHLGNRSTLATHRTYTGKKILELHSDISLPTYLRSWVALHYENDTWSTANDRDRKIYTELVGEDFEPEAITQYFFDVASPGSQAFDLDSDYANYTDHGFVSTLVSIDVIRSGGNLLYLPSRFDTEYGLLGYVGKQEQQSKPYAETYEHYFDGVLTTGWLNLNKRYSAVAHLPLYRDPDYEKTMANLLYQYDANVEAISEYYARVQAGDAYTYESFEQEYYLPNVDYAPFKAFTQLSAEEQAAYYNENIVKADVYRRYVYSHYTKTLGSERVRALAGQLEMGIGPTVYADIPLGESNLIQFYSAQNFKQTYAAVREVIDYLREGYTYTLTPTQKQSSIDTRGYDSVETFLFLTKEGYCVQYATAATFLLREMGIPVRYVEGYMVQGLEYNADTENRVQKYSQTVRDQNAHAWIEVYFDDIGWLPFEVTAPYYDGMYAPFSAGGTQTPQDPPETQAPETLPMQPPETEADPVPHRLAFGGITAGQTLIVTAVIGAAAFLCFAVYRSYQRKGRLAIRQSRIKRALEADSLTQEEIRELAKYFADQIIKTAEAGGVERDANEYPLDFASRIDQSLAALKNAPALCYSFEQIVPLMEKAAFGREVEREELRMLAEFWISLRGLIYERFNPWERFYYGTVKEMI